MRKEKGYKLYIIGVLMLLVLTLPVALSSSLRSGMSTLLKPLWELTHPKNSSKIARLESRVLELEAERALFLSDLKASPNLKGVLPARVIFRSHAAWQSYLWVDKGDLDAPFQLLNAPVLKGDTLVGVVDEVKSHAARVRLLTDPLLTPSVRVLRGEQFLAKGELNGRLKPTFRESGAFLKGSGFNYDFPDEEGEAVDLRETIVRAGDLLITTGFDGVFPKGLKVAKVTKVASLKEGDYYYDIEAKSLASFNDLEYIQIIPGMPSI